MAILSDRLVRWTYLRIVHGLALVTLLLKPTIALAVTLSCPGQDITVSAPFTSLANRACSVAAASRAILASCNLQQTVPYSIEVNSLLPPDFHDCFGIYHCDDNLVQVLAPDALSEAVQRTDTFTNLPLDVLFDSLLVHEISHVLTYQSNIGVPRTAAEVEYIAYAMQMELLPASVRDDFVAAHPVTQPVTLMALNSTVFSFSPEVFAVKAWLHFRTEGNGCEFVRRSWSKK